MPWSGSPAGENSKELILFVNTVTQDVVWLSSQRDSVGSPAYDAAYLDTCGWVWLFLDMRTALIMVNNVQALLTG